MHLPDNLVVFRKGCVREFISWPAASVWSLEVVLSSITALFLCLIAPFLLIVLSLCSCLIFSFLFHLPVPERRAVWSDSVVTVVAAPLHWQMVLSPRRSLIPTDHPSQHRGRQEILGTRSHSAETLERILQTPSCPKDLPPCSSKVKPFSPHSSQQGKPVGFAGNWTNLLQKSVTEMKVIPERRGLIL